MYSTFDSTDDDVDGDVIEAIGSQRKLVSEGTCMGFCRKELNEVWRGIVKL